MGTYYPQDLPKKEWLSYYAKEFNTLEINFTYYRMPTAKSLFLMANKVPNRFLFTVKATQEMTHARERDPKLFSQFTQAITPLREAAKFGCVLAQFPSSFHAGEESREYLKWFRAQMGELAIVVEFRNKDWLTEGTYELLRACNLGFCSVDEPYFPPRGASDGGHCLRPLPWA